MATEVLEPRPSRPGPAVPLVDDSPADGHRCACGTLITPGARSCRVCLHQASADFADRCRVMEAANMTAIEIAESLSVPRQRVRRALRRAERLGMTRQGAR